MNRSTPGLPVHHQLPEFIQTHVHRVSDAIQPSHPLSSPSPPVPNTSQNQGLFQRVNSSHEVAKVLEFQLYPLDCKEIQPVHPKGDQSEYSLEGLILKLKLQYFGHLMRRTDSLEKTLKLGNIESRRRRGWQRMRWLDGIIDSMDVSLSKFQVAKSRTQLSNWTETGDLAWTERWPQWLQRGPPGNLSHPNSSEDTVWDLDSGQECAPSTSSQPPQEHPTPRCLGCVLWISGAHATYLHGSHPSGGGGP